MQITITGRNLEVTPPMREHIEKRLYTKLKKYFHSIVDAHVVVFLQRFEHICEVTLNADGVTLHGHEKTNDLYVSVDRVVDKLERQLKKYKEKLRNHRTRANPDETPLHLHVDVLDGEDVDASLDQPQIIYTKAFDLKPMSVDEAATQMDLFNQDFLVFLNPQFKHVNVLYRRRDGNYCLIDPKL